MWLSVSAPSHTLDRQSGFIKSRGFASLLRDDAEYRVDDRDACVACRYSSHSCRIAAPQNSRRFGLRPFLRHGLNVASVEDSPTRLQMKPGFHPVRGFGRAERICKYYVCILKHSFDKATKMSL